MTNAEKYLKDGISAEEFLEKVIEHCSQGTKYSIETFLKAEVTPALTEDERVILRNINKKFNRIERNEFGFLILTENGCENVGEAMHTLYAFNHLFQFIKERRRIFNRRIIRRAKMTKKRKDEIAKKIKQLEKELSGMPTGFYTGVNGKAIRI